MGDETTFAELIDNPSSEKIFLLEINPARQLNDWSVLVWNRITEAGDTRITEAGDTRILEDEN